jgi:hypothetical protein
MRDQVVVYAEAFPHWLYTDIDDEGCVEVVSVIRLLLVGHSLLIGSDSTYLMRFAGGGSFDTLRLMGDLGVSSPEFGIVAPVVRFLRAVDVEEGKRVAVGRENVLPSNPTAAAAAGLGYLNLLGLQE